MAQKDYYQTLGISKNANEDDIKKAYRTLAKKYHPDLNHDQDAPQKFKEVQEAYECLSDPQKRSYYDKYGTAEPNQGFGGFGNQGFSSDFGSSFGGFEDLGDIFSSFFGGGSSRREQSGPIKGQDIQKRMTITLNDVIFGKKTKMDIPVYEKCPHCSGTGAYSREDIVTCPKCNGRGSIIAEVNTLFGRTQTKKPCPDCNGTGKYIKNKCIYCKGEGKTKVNKTITVDIPIGIQTGQQIRFSGFGGKGYNGGQNGDLYIQFVVKEDPTYKRNGDDLYMNQFITFGESALGIEKPIVTPYGDDKISIPEGTQTGTTIRLRGRGIPNIQNGLKGDLYVKLIVQTPKNLTQEQKELLMKFENIEPKQNRFSKKKK